MKLLSTIYSKFKSCLFVTLYSIVRPIFQCLHIDIILEYVFGIKRHIICKLDGGIGSQVWQFALGYSIAKDLNMPLYLDIDFFRTSCSDIKGNKNRHFLLMKTFPEIEKKYKGKILAHRVRHYSRLLEHKINKTIYEIEPAVYENRSKSLWAYYINYRYVHKYHKELKELFKFADIKLTDYEQSFMERISKTSSCCIHIRRGDFVGSNHEVCTKSYYQNAIKSVEEKIPDVSFFIFSDDESYAMKICEEAKITHKSAIFANRNDSDPRTDLYLMSRFRHFIISNSGFSWFPAWLNSDSVDQIVIMPRFWTADKELRELSSSAMNLPHWIQLAC